MKKTTFLAIAVLGFNMNASVSLGDSGSGGTTGGGVWPGERGPFTPGAPQPDRDDSENRKLVEKAYLQVLSNLNEQGLSEHSIDSIEMKRLVSEQASIKFMKTSSNFTYEKLESWIETLIDAEISQQ